MFNKKVVACVAVAALAAFGAVSVATMASAAISVTPKGYRIVGADGHVHAFGARNARSRKVTRSRKAVVGIASTPKAGYWTAAPDGSVSRHGDARAYGSARKVPLHKPVVGMAAT